MRTKWLLAFTMLAFLTSGRAPGMPELRNPDAAKGGARTTLVLKRGIA